MTGPILVELNDEEVEVRVRQNAQARRMILRVCPTSGDIKLTVPKRTGKRAAQRFVTSHLDWIGNERSRALEITPLGHGDTLMFEGQPLTVCYTDVSPRGVNTCDGAIHVGGPADHAPRRLLVWLKAEARKRVAAASERHATALGVQFNRIGIGDMKSRWGSCSSRGTLKFNWRLVMAPAEVLDYVAAHEVAHLLEMNHSDRFWAHVERCVQGYERHRRWLKHNGQGLFAVKI